MVKEKSTFNNVPIFLMLIIFFILPHTCTLTRKIILVDYSYVNYIQGEADQVTTQWLLLKWQLLLKCVAFDVSSCKSYWQATSTCYRRPMPPNLSLTAI